MVERMEVRGIPVPAGHAVATVDARRSRHRATNSLTPPGEPRLARRNVAVLVLPRRETTRSDGGAGGASDLRRLPEASIPPPTLIGCGSPRSCTTPCSALTSLSK